ncbi:MAG: filamentous hemagglutinin family protein [Burkholderiaceae bacterium]|nr:filamentous hemagglutinin family protein [Burkholderiaceae bacterium]
MSDAATMFPSSTGQLRLLADGSISGFAFFKMGQGDPTVLPTIANPATPGLADGGAIDRPTLSAGVLHLGDPNPVEIVARTGSIEYSIITVPKAAEIAAGDNIGPNVYLSVQNDSATDLTRISAGNSIQFPTADTLAGIFVDGPGAAEIVAGGPINLGITGFGFQSAGNLYNTTIAPQGASLIIAAGTGKNAAGLANRPDYANVIDNFVSNNAFASSGSNAPTLNQQVLAQLAGDPALADLVSALQAALATRSTGGNPLPAIDQEITRLAKQNPAELAEGAVKLATAIQVAANKQFVQSRNSDTFAPAYAAFGDLFPALNNNAAALRQFVQNNPFAGADDAAALRDQALTGLAPDLVNVIRLGLAAPSSANDPDSAFSKALAALDPTTLAQGARQLLANVLVVAGQSLDALRAQGRLSGPGSPYALALTHFAAAFSPSTPAGLNDLQMDYNTIVAQQTGNIALFAPQGGVIVGQSAAPALFAGEQPKTPSQLGIFSYGGGAIDGMVRDNFDVYRSRVFTVAGGDIDLWSSLANIDAGRGARDVTVAPPPQLVIDPKTGVVTLDLGATVTGSGIGALETQANQPPSDINLMAPAGYVDAGEAGIRAQTGTVTLGTNLVLNASNIQAAAGVSGGAVVVAPPPPPPPSAVAGSGSNAVEEAQREAMAQQLLSAEQFEARQRMMRVVGEFLGFGNDCPKDDTSDKCAQGKDADKPKEDR